PHHGILWKKNAEGNNVDGVESSDNSHQLETNRAHEAEVLASLESNCGLYFVGDCLLAHLLFAQADAGPNQVVFDAVELSGSGSPGTIVQYDWQLLHWDNSQFNRTAAGVSPTISNLEPGFYTVVLTVTNDLGCGGESSKILAAAGPCRRTSASSYLLLLDVRLEPLVRHRF
ncbi:MAG: PKD domain-containing protein, partial [Desulforhabdus sp.]|nr:PKD domain-containing protein [Desulforhabdus sp.]